VAGRRESLGCLTTVSRAHLMHVYAHRAPPWSILFCPFRQQQHGHDRRGFLPDPPGQNHPLAEEVR